MQYQKPLIRRFCFLAFAFSCFAFSGCHSLKNNLISFDDLRLWKTSVSEETLCIEVVARYSKALLDGEWLGLCFLDDRDREILFYYKDSKGNLLKSFWSKEPTGSDPENVTVEYHTIPTNVGKRYQITYMIKKIKYSGFDVDGTHIENENVIVKYKEIR